MAKILMSQNIGLCGAAGKVVSKSWWWRGDSQKLERLHASAV